MGAKATIIARSQIVTALALLICIGQRVLCSFLFEKALIGNLKKQPVFMFACFPRCVFFYRFQVIGTLS